MNHYDLLIKELEALEKDVQLFLEKWEEEDDEG